jgi:hypothetical protein
MKFMAGLIVGLTISTALAGEEHHKVIDCPAGNVVTLLINGGVIGTLSCPAGGEVVVTVQPGGSYGSGGIKAGSSQELLSGTFPASGANGGGGTAKTTGQVICPPSDQNLPCILNDPARGLTSIQPR